MFLLKFINEYQALLGSFLAVIFSVGFWYFKDSVEKRRLKKDHAKEIENIFFLAARESEEALKDIRYYLTMARKDHQNKVGEFPISLPPKFSRVHIDEERVTALKQYFGFIVSQQIDIAVSAANKFNGYLEQIEGMPKFIFDSMIKRLQAGLASKEQAQGSYFGDQERFLKGLEPLMEDINVAQRHLLRPLVALIHAYKEPRGVVIDMDEILDREADLILAALKRDLA